MTLHDFSKLLYLRKEIIVEQKHLEELEKAIVMQQITLLIYPTFACNHRIVKYKLN